MTQMLWSETNVMVSKSTQEQMLVQGTSPMSSSYHVPMANRQSQAPLR